MDGPQVNTGEIKRGNRKWPRETTLLFWNPYAIFNMAKIMRNMDFFPGLGLGKRQQGIQTCIEHNFRQKNEGIGMLPEESAKFGIAGSQGKKRRIIFEKATSEPEDKNEHR